MSLSVENLFMTREKIIIYHIVSIPRGKAYTNVERELEYFINTLAMVYFLEVSPTTPYSNNLIDKGNLYQIINQHKY
jgi:hypothetical protein